MLIDKPLAIRSRWLVHPICIFISEIDVYLSDPRLAPAINTE